ncbi:unnamed protein product [Chondrus crispus]|uniref:Uncharacterized protein n=1 Tax=Chondrus crispus TaxID=2769 RepID=R7QL51_CHOCR|nr:unnamed protein product [Chondrus crispus]CDF38809.1 unnamed protein product [Chondrus crispus]|eukprot:XP_005718714.1 unnamed protein product [Chondrus crispus]
MNDLDQSNDPILKACQQQFSHFRHDTFMPVRTNEGEQDVVL